MLWYLINTIFDIILKQNKQLLYMWQFGLYPMKQMNINLLLNLVNIKIILNNI